LRDTRARSLVKAVAWRITGILLGIVLTWLFYPLGRIGQTIMFAVIYHAIRTAQYYLNERFWERIKWGRKESHGVK